MGNIVKISGAIYRMAVTRLHTTPWVYLYGHDRDKPINNLTAGSNHHTYITMLAVKKFAVVRGWMVSAEMLPMGNIFVYGILCLRLLGSTRVNNFTLCQPELV